MEGVLIKIYKTSATEKAKYRFGFKSEENRENCQVINNKGNGRIHGDLLSDKEQSFQTISYAQ